MYIQDTLTHVKATCATIARDNLGFWRSSNKLISLAPEMLLLFCLEEELNGSVTQIGLHTGIVNGVAFMCSFISI